MKVDAFKLSQWGNRGNIELYSCILNAGDIVDDVNLDIWEKDNYGGYQRIPSANRFKNARGSILRYLTKEMGCFPSSILLNCRGKVDFVPERAKMNYILGELSLNMEEVWVIDGQHRIKALSKAIERNDDFRDYPVNTTLVRFTDRFDELLLFYLINRRQKGVPTDLAYRHLQRMLWQKGEEWIMDFEGKPGLDRSYSMEIVDILNSEPISPWNNRIRVVHEARLNNHLIEDNQYASTVLPLLKDRNFKGKPIKTIARYLIDYWNALYRLFPECFEHPKEYVLMNRTGVNVLNRVFKEMFPQLEDVHEEDMYAYISHLARETPEHSVSDFRKPLSSDFWHREHGSEYVKDSSKHGRDELFAHLHEKLWLSRP